MVDRISIPVLSWFKSYNKQLLSGDVRAGITVGVMLIPQGMAYAMIAGLPPIHGLYAATLPLVIYALLGTSRQLAVGPAAMVSLLTAAGIGLVANGDSSNYLALAVSLAFLVGLMQVALGIFKLGNLVNFLSQPVISGFTSAAAIIIGLSQVNHLLGIDIGRHTQIQKIVVSIFEKFGEIHWLTVAIGLVGIFVIKGLKYWTPKLPAPLLAVAFGIGGVMAFDLANQGVQVIGAIPSGLPRFSLPLFSWATFKALIPIAAAIALISFMESYSVAGVVQAQHKDYVIRPNQELIAIGMANIGAAMIQAFPVTGGLSRTAVNNQAGAKTKFAGVISAILIVLTLLFLTPIFYFLPKVILAAIILVAVYGLIDIKAAKKLWSSNRSDFWMLIVTFIATLTLGIQIGIGTGVVLSLALIIFRTSRPHIAELGRIPNTNFYRNVDRFEQVITQADILIIRFDAQLYFANSQFFRERVDALAFKKKVLETIILNFNSINNLDSSAADMLEQLVQDYRNQKITILFSGVKGPVRDGMSKANLTQKIGIHHFFINVQKAVNFANNQIDSSTILEDPLKKYLIQTNKT